MEFVSMKDVIKTRYYLLAKDEKNRIDGVRKHGGCDSKHDITYLLRKK